jgi:hypothetical protein
MGKSRLSEEVERSDGSVSREVRLSCSKAEWRTDVGGCQNMLRNGVEGWLTRVRDDAVSGARDRIR